MNTNDMIQCAFKPSVNIVGQSQYVVASPRCFRKSFLYESRVTYFGCSPHPLQDLPMSGYARGGPTKSRMSALFWTRAFFPTINIVQSLHFPAPLPLRLFAPWDTLANPISCILSDFIMSIRVHHETL